MNTYKVLLGIETGASTTRQRLSLNVPADNRLSAAIVAEKCGDQYVNDPTGATYTHTLSVKRLPSPKPSFMRLAMGAA
jgi:hypothetical protein